MLLRGLPLSYAMFCALCVRIVELQNTSDNQEMVTAAIDSADLWVSWALWSILELFVLDGVFIRNDLQRRHLG